MAAPIFDPLGVGPNFGIGEIGGFLGLRKYLDPAGFQKDFLAASSGGTAYNIGDEPGGINNPNPPTGVAPGVPNLWQQGQSFLDRNQTNITQRLTTDAQNQINAILSAIPQDFGAQRAAGQGQITNQTNQLTNALSQGAARRGLSSGGSQGATAATNVTQGANLQRQSLDQDIANRESQVAQFKAAIQSGSLDKMNAVLTGYDMQHEANQVGLFGDQASAFQAIDDAKKNEAFMADLVSKYGPNIIQILTNLGVDFFNLRGNPMIALGTGAAGQIFNP